MNRFGRSFKTHSSKQKNKRKDDLHPTHDWIYKSTSASTRNNKSIDLLVRAVISGKIERVKKLIDAGIDVNGLPLFVAVKIGRKDIAQMLIESGANVDDQDQYGDTSLHYAVRNDDLEMIKLLLSAGASPDLVNKRGSDTPLLLALKSPVPSKKFFEKPALHSAKNITKLLAKFDDGINNLDDLYDDLLDDLDDLDDLDILVGLGGIDDDDDDDDDDPSLTSSLDREIEKLVSKRRKSNPNKAGVRGSISEAAKSSDHKVPRKRFDKAQILLNAGASPNIADGMGVSPLQLAMESGQIDIIQQLIDAGVDLNSCKPIKGAGIFLSSSPLEDAITLCNMEILELLLKHGANPNHPGTFVLGHAAMAKSNKIPMLKTLLECGANPSCGLAFNSLMRDNDVKGMQLLFEYGFNPFKCDVFLGLTRELFTENKYPFERGLDNIFRTKNDTRMLSLILDHFKSKGTLSQALKPNRSDSNWTLLHYAAQQGEFEHVKLLLQAGADPNPVATDDHGTTPLHLALCRSREILKGTEQCVKLLVKAGVNPQNSIDRLVGIISSDIDRSLRYDEPNESSECESADTDSEVCKYFPSEIQWRRLGKSRYAWIHHSSKKALIAIKYRLLLESKTAVEDPMPENFTKSAELRRYYKSCKIEIDLMQNYKFHESITYHNVLTDEDFYKRMESSKALEQFSRPLIHDDVLATINIYAADLEQFWSQAHEKYKLWLSSSKYSSPPVISANNSKNDGSNQMVAMKEADKNSSALSVHISKQTEEESTMELDSNVECLSHDCEIQTAAVAETNQTHPSIVVDSSRNYPKIMELARGIRDVDFELLDMLEQSSKIPAKRLQKE
ncbi:hypothetical protein QAD02_000167 [Eretmocerus hayati]|uniref:Uncharacterized protein n=1 Tax=Eretmocerus hayati TaxID=131215 RepID=A0ACC2ND60_9HYME|nr:hypothetical protein QAD02_000167 [Eretmocerus hayati]